MSLLNFTILLLTSCEYNLLYRYWNGKRRFILEILFIINLFWKPASKRESTNFFVIFLQTTITVTSFFTT